jgi:hypothetical protein
MLWCMSMLSYMSMWQFFVVLQISINCTNWNSQDGFQLELLMQNITIATLIFLFKHVSIQVLNKKERIQNKYCVNTSTSCSISCMGHLILNHSTLRSYNIETVTCEISGSYIVSINLPQRYRHHVPLRCWYTLTRPYSVTFQNPLTWKLQHVQKACTESVSYNLYLNNIIKLQFAS